MLVVVVLALPARKAIDDEDDDEDEHDKTREFSDRACGHRRPRSAGEEAIDDDHDDEDEDDKTREFPDRARGRRPRSAGKESNRRRGRARPRKRGGLSPLTDSTNGPLVSIPNKMCNRERAYELPQTW